VKGRQKHSQESKGGGEKGRVAVAKGGSNFQKVVQEEGRRQERHGFAGVCVLRTRWRDNCDKGEGPERRK
jgi:hypothetical protein